MNILAQRSEHAGICWSEKFIDRSRPLLVSGVILNIIEPDDGRVPDVETKVGGGLRRPAASEHSPSSAALCQGALQT